MASRYIDIVPLCVHGGWQIAQETVTRTLDGWDASDRVLSTEKYPTFEACFSAIADLQVRAIEQVAA